jgi:ABC-type antimicrobial peptide transport system permease subunit
MHSARSAESALAAIDQALVVYNVESMERANWENASGIQAAADAMTRYGVVALLLALTGIFGVLTCFVAQRTRDIGIRIALGADAQLVLAMALRRSLAPALVGVAIGIAEAYAVSRLMSSVLYIVRLDVMAFVGCGLTMCVTALLASYLPARRATKVDPVIALRDA